VTLALAYFYTLSIGCPMKSTISFFVRSKNAIMQNGITNASHASFGLVEFKKMLIASSLGVLLPNAHAEDLKLASASSDSVVNAATQATVPPPVPSTTDYDALFAKLQPKGFNIGLPGPTDTVDPQAFGLRKALADMGIGYFGMNIINTAGNTLANSARETNGKQSYNGQKFTYYDTLYAGLTYDLSRYGIPDRQIYVAGMLNWVSWQPMGPNKFGISEASYYQTLLNKRFELKLGYLANSWEFVNYSVGGSLASSVFGPSGSIPIQGGMSNNETPTPGANLTVNVTDKFYVKGGVQRSVNPDGLQAEIKYNQRGFKWNTPNAGTLSIGEVGYKQTPKDGTPYTWVRAGGAYNDSSSNSYSHPGTRTDHNSWYYLLGDRQIWQMQPGSSPGRGIYVGGSVMYAPPESNVVSQYYEARIYGKGLIKSRPYDLASLVLTDTVWSQYAVDNAADKGSMVHRDSKAATLSYSARITNGVYAGIGLAYVNHPTTIAYQSDTGSALNLLANLNVFF